jgi:hypothetical protein
MTTARGSESTVCGAKVDPGKAGRNLNRSFSVFVNTTATNPT